VIDDRYVERVATSRDPFMAADADLGSRLGVGQVLECLFRQAPVQLFRAVITGSASTSANAEASSWRVIVWSLL
jgi:hypothetical protein